MLQAGTSPTFEIWGGKSKSREMSKEEGMRQKRRDVTMSIWHWHQAQSCSSLHQRSDRESRLHLVRLLITMGQFLWSRPSPNAIDANPTQGFRERWRGLRHEHKEDVQFWRASGIIFQARRRASGGWTKTLTVLGREVVHGRCCHDIIMIAHGPCCCLITKPSKTDER